MNYASRYFWSGILLALLIASSAQAGGLYLYELGNPDVGAASAGWAARAQDAATVFTNPAGMTRLAKSELLAGVQPVYLHADFSPDAGTTASGSDGDASTWLPAGSLYYVHNLMPKLKIGVSATGCFGLGLEYENDWSEKLALGVGYTFLWSGDLDMDVNRGPLARRVSGTYENVSMSFINCYLNWKF